MLAAPCRAFPRLPGQGSSGIVLPYVPTPSPSHACHRSPCQAGACRAFRACLAYPCRAPPGPCHAASRPAPTSPAKTGLALPAVPRPALPSATGSGRSVDRQASPRLPCQVLPVPAQPFVFVPARPCQCHAVRRLAMPALPGRSSAQRCPVERCPTAPSSAMQRLPWPAAPRPASPRTAVAKRDHAPPDRACLAITLLSQRARTGSPAGLPLHSSFPLPAASRL